MKKLRNFVLLSVLLVLALCAAAVVFFMSQSPKTRAVVQIESPTNGQLVGQGDPFMLSAFAESNRPILRLEVYANGTLVAAVNGARDQYSLDLNYPLFFSAPGRHIFVARAFFSPEDFTDSDLVTVDVAGIGSAPVQVNVDDIPRGEGVTDITVGDLAAALGVPPAQIASLNPGLPPAPESVIPPGTPLTLPPAAAAPPPAETPIVSAPPAPPEEGVVEPPAVVVPPVSEDGGEVEAPRFAAVPPVPEGFPRLSSSPNDPVFDGLSQSCSQIAFRWRPDPDALAYKIYRWAPGDPFTRDPARLSPSILPDTSLLAAVPAGTTTYTDVLVTGRPGIYLYILATVRSSGERMTSVLRVEVPEDCVPSRPSGNTGLKLLLLDLTTTQSFSKVYCYVSVNGSRYERLPGDQEGLLPTEGSTVFNLPVQLPNRGLFGVSVNSDGVIQLNGECWGQQDTTVVLVGRFSASHPSSDWTGRDLTTKLTAALPRALASASQQPLGSSGNTLRYRILPGVAGLDLGSVAPGALRSLYVDVPLVATGLEGPDFTIPAPRNVRKEAFPWCDTFPSTDPNVGLSVCTGPLAPAIRWDWNPDALTREEDVLGWRMDVSYIRNTPGEGERVIPGDSLLIARLPDSRSAGRSAPYPVIPARYACGTTVRVTITAITPMGDSMPSEPLLIPPVACPSTASLLITVESLSVLPSTTTGEVLDDGDLCILCADRRLELYGGLITDDVSSVLRPNRNFGVLAFGACPTNANCFAEGVYPSNALGPWLAPRTLRNVTDNVWITIQVIEYDLYNNHDTFCFGGINLPARSADAWRQMDERFTVASDYGEARCEMVVRVQGAP